MSRGSEREHGESFEPSLDQSRMPLSQGRSGPGDSASVSDDSLRSPRSSSSADRSQLAEAIERIARSRPTMSQFVERLDKEGIRALPSIQSSGRLNGMAYESGGVRVNGSELGRGYTAVGLQRRFGVQYEPSRDDETLARAAGRLPLSDRKHTYRERSDTAAPNQPERESPSRRGRDRSGLNDQERAILQTVGTFRVVAVEDLQRHSAMPTPDRLPQDLKRLVAQGLVEKQTVPCGRTGESVQILSLTKAGLTQARLSAAGSAQQRLYAGFVKPNEVKHDLAILRMYQAHADKIARAGGAIRRVVLDFELKRNVYRDLAKASDLPALAHAQRKEQIAAENGLKVVEGRIILPDLRIEYDTEEGERTKVDLEVTSEDYKRSQMQQKARAGFGIYALGLKASSRCSAIQDGPELVEGILSF